MLRCSHMQVAGPRLRAAHPAALGRPQHFARAPLRFSSSASAITAIAVSAATCAAVPSAAAPAAAAPAAAAAASRRRPLTFEQRIAQLERFYKEHGHSRVPVDDPLGASKNAELAGNK